MYERQRLYGPHEPYTTRRETRDGATAMTLHDEGHTPYNQRPGSRDSIADLEVNCGVDHVSFRAEERTRGPSGQFQTRVISVTMPREYAERLAQHVLTGARVHPDELQRRVHAALDNLSAEPNENGALTLNCEPLVTAGYLVAKVANLRGLLLEHLLPHIDAWRECARRVV